MKRIVVDCGIFQKRIALVEDKNLIEYIIEDDSEKSLVGNIYKGKVANVLPGMEAAFVDIGIGKNAYLHVKQILTDKKDSSLGIRGLVKTGQDIVVQVIKDGTSGKGPKVTTKLSFPGKYMVLMMENTKIAMSRRITNPNEIERLITIVEEFKPDDLGVIIRTEAENKDGEEFRRDLAMLIEKRDTVLKRSKTGLAPKAISDEINLIERTIRDILTEDVDEVVINDKATLKQIKNNDFLSEEYKDKLVFNDPGIDIMSFYGITKLLSKSLANKVWLKNGGHLVIQNTEAMTIIDVNSGKFTGGSSLKDTIVKVNQEAVKEVAKQVRLRNLSGIIIVDLIDMNSKSMENKILAMLKEELSSDRVRSNVLGFTRLGLIEMTRKKSGKPLKDILYEDCKLCDGTSEVLSVGAIVNKLEKEVRRLREHTNSEAVVFRIRNQYIPYKDEIQKYGDKLEEQFDIKLFFEFEELFGNEDSFFVKSMGRLKDVKNN